MKRNKNFLFPVLAGAVLASLVVLTTFVSCTSEPSTAAPSGTTPPPVLDLVEMQNTFRRVASETLPVVVRIDVEEVRRQRAPADGQSPWFDFFFGQPDGDGNREFRTQGLGSGIVVRNDGNGYYVLTNYHVVGDAEQITVRLDDGRDFTASMVGSDERLDLAMVRFESSEALPVARLGDSESLHVGDWVLAIGSPFGFQSTVTAGIVSALGRRGGPDGNISDFIQTDAAINRGNSGGALVNLNGEVVGINTWITSQTGGSVGLGFSIPINNAKRAIDDFITQGSVRYGWLGVSIRSVTNELAGSLDLPDSRGALIVHIFTNSPADQGGLLPGDFVRRINGRTVRDSDQLVLDVGALPVDQQAEFVVIRDGAERTVRVRIAERQSERAIAESNIRLWPGITVFPITSGIRQELSLPAGATGVVVSAVEARTAAATAGFRVGDVVRTVNGTPVDSARAFYRLLNSAGANVRIGGTRGESAIEFALSR